MTAREEVLRRIRRALGGPPRPTADVPRGYRSDVGRVAGDPLLVELFIDRLVDYGAGVHRTEAASVPVAVTAALSAGLARRAAPAGGEANRPRVAVPTGLAARWVEALDAQVVPDLDLDPATLDGLDAVVTGAAVAIAETGTIVLDASPDQGRRILTLLPDVHVCVVAAEQIVALVPEALRLLDPTRPLTWISGGSATSDIELDRVEGVHGPRILEVVVSTA